MTSTSPSRRSDMDHTVWTPYTPCLPLAFVRVHQMAPPRTVVTTSSCSILLIYRPRKKERLSWPSWLTYSRRLVDPRKWSPVSCRSSAGRRKLAGQRAMFYAISHGTNHKFEINNPAFLRAHELVFYHVYKNHLKTNSWSCDYKLWTREKIVFSLILNMADQADDESLKGKRVRNFVVYYYEILVGVFFDCVVSKSTLWYGLAHKQEGYVYYQMGRSQTRKVDMLLMANTIGSWAQWWQQNAAKTVWYSMV